MLWLILFLLAILLIAGPRALGWVIMMGFSAYVLFFIWVAVTYGSR